jgi:hypothetical protein
MPKHFWDGGNDVKITGKGLKRKMRSRSVMHVGALLVVFALAAPPAYAGWGEILAAAGSIASNIFGGQGRFAVAFTTGQVAQTKAKENMTDTEALNERQNVNAKTAQEIAVAHHIPKNYSACKHSQRVGSRSAALGSTAAFGRALSTEDSIGAAGLKKEGEGFKKQIAQACGPENGPLYNAKKAMGCSGNARGDSASDPTTVLKASYKVPDNVEMKGVGQNTPPGDWGPDYKDAEDARRFCHSLAYRRPPDPAGSTPTAGYADYMVQKSQSALYGGSAQAICNNLFAMSTKGGPLKDKQKDYQEKAVAAHHLDSVDSEGMSGWDMLANDSHGFYATTAYTQQVLTTLPSEYAVKADANFKIGRASCRERVS